MSNKIIVDAMVGICIKNPDLFLTPPSNVRNIAEGSLSEFLKNAMLSPNAKTAYIIAQGSLSFKESEKQASQDLPVQMNNFMINNGLESSKYDIKYFSENLRSDIKVLWAVAVQKNHH